MLGNPFYVTLFARDVRNVSDRSSVYRAEAVSSDFSCMGDHFVALWLFPRRSRLCNHVGTDFDRGKIFRDKHIKIWSAFSGRLQINHPPQKTYRTRGKNFGSSRQCLCVNFAHIRVRVNILLARSTTDPVKGCRDYGFFQPTVYYAQAHGSTEFTQTLHRIRSRTATELFCESG